MATAIAFALSVIALFGSRAPASLKIFLTAVAVIEDFCAIIVIALIYSAKFSLLYLSLAISVLIGLAVMNRMREKSLVPFLLGGALMCFFMLQSGFHATIADVLLAFTIPFTPVRDDRKSPSHILEHFLHKPVAFFIMPLFALCNTGIVIGADWAASLTSSNSLGISIGLLIGKMISVSVFSFLAVNLGICNLPLGMAWRHVVGAGFLAGVGFTMSIFITNLAFTTTPELISSSIMVVLLISVVSGIIGYAWLMFCRIPIIT